MWHSNQNTHCHCIKNLAGMEERREAVVVHRGSDGESIIPVDSISNVAKDYVHREESNEAKIKSNGRLAVKSILHSF